MNILGYAAAAFISQVENHEKILLCKMFQQIRAVLFIFLSLFNEFH